VNCNESWLPMDDLVSPVYGHMSDLCEGCIRWGDCRGYFYQPAVVNGVLSIITGERTMKWIQNDCGITCKFDLRGSTNSVTISPHVHIYKDAEDKVSVLLGLGSKVFMPKGALKSLIVLSERPPSDWNPDGMSQVGSNYRPEENSQCAIDSEYDFDPQPRRKKKEGQKRVQQVRQNRGPPSREIPLEVPSHRRGPAPLERYRGDNFGARTIRPPEPPELRIESRGQILHMQERFRHDRLQEDMVPDPVQPIQVETLRAPEVLAQGRPSVAPSEPATELRGSAEWPAVPPVSEQHPQGQNLDITDIPSAIRRPSSPAFGSPSIYRSPEAKARYNPLRGRPLSMPQFRGPTAPISSRRGALLDILRKTEEEISGYDRAIDDVGAKCDQLKTFGKHFQTILNTADVDLRHAKTIHRQLMAQLEEQISKRKKLEGKVTRLTGQIQREQRETEKLQEELQERKYHDLDEKKESPQQHSSENTSKRSHEQKYSRSHYSSEETGVHSYNLISTEDSKTFSIPSRS